MLGISGVLFYASVDLGKAFDRVPSEVVLRPLGKLGVDEWLVKGVMAIYENARTVVITEWRTSGEFKIKGEVHQGPVLSSSLSVVVMEAPVSKVRDDLPWELLWAGNLVLVTESTDELKERC